MYVCVDSDFSRLSITHVRMHGIIHTFGMYIHTTTHIYTAAAFAQQLKPIYLQSNQASIEALINELHTVLILFHLPK